MFNRCMDCIDKNNISNEKQFGFRSNRSTYMAIVELVDKVTSAAERHCSFCGKNYESSAVRRSFFRKAPTETKSK